MVGSRCNCNGGKYHSFYNRRDCQCGDRRKTCSVGINGLFFGIAKPSTSDEITTSYLRGTFSIDYSDLNAVVGDADYVFVGTVASEEGTVYKDAVTVETERWKDS